MWYPQYYGNCPPNPSPHRGWQGAEQTQSQPQVSTNDEAPLPTSWQMTDTVEDLSLPSPIQTKPPPIQSSARPASMAAKETVNFCVTSVGRNRFLQRATGSFGGDD